MESGKRLNECGYIEGLLSFMRASSNGTGEDPFERVGKGCNLVIEYHLADPVPRVEVRT